ncbi:MAG TPA: hypothetical protein VKO43_06520 [Candidatus Krumholzibacteriaceae bacterium]|nr:hypothetical protein [Candidatus Krumholzibacteriaceae bacterium]
MRKLLIFKVFLVQIVISAFFNESPAGDTTGEKKKGLVIYRDRVLEPPFKFTGHGPDTLRLNGIPYFPARRIDPKFEPQPPKRIHMDEWNPEEIKLPSMKEYGKMHRLSVRADKSTDSVDTLEDKLDVYAETMSRSSMVDSAIIKNNEILVYWKYDRPIPEYHSLACQGPHKLTEEQRHARRLEMDRNQEKRFWKTYNDGGTIVFGAGPGITYAPESSTPRNLRAINKILSGDTLTEREKRSTVFNQKTLYKLYIERYKREKGEE